MKLEYDLEKDYETDETIVLKIERKGLNIGLLILQKEQANPRNYRKLTIF